jgi:hypothetical protein
MHTDSACGLPPLPLLLRAPAVPTLIVHPIIVPFHSQRNRFALANSSFASGVPALTVIRKPLIFLSFPSSGKNQVQIDSW